ncbi:hypothetical protein EC973_005495 [Apophysomyces ossiformis]|uniref:Heterokaryon incompatibility domain-containing protein n=1 Tax=Apophysomyces ossiformis TaxID=679940 RepID=A0A8H7ELA9_9FUNG|nr:hypothetical protein EC973_005495 [Apophysomyces ossiformis]
MSEIVLLDTGSDFDNIKCISVPFDDRVPAYYAISYRWGRHPEWKAQTPNYVASITSVSQGNLIKLCKLYRRKVRYLWIDVVCINQADKKHRKMAIKNMDKIYRKAKRIIAVPDLCYCNEYPLMEDVTKEDIQAGLIKIRRECDYRIWGSDFTRSEGIPLDLGFRFDDYNLPVETDLRFEEDIILRDYVNLKERMGNGSKGKQFVYDVLNEWAERAWVVSERIIGVNEHKLLIHILRSNTVAIWDVFYTFDCIRWSLETNYGDLFVTICNSKSTKIIDRLFAILPHTGYKDLVPKLVDEGATADSEEDFKWLLFDILDEGGRDELLYYLFDKAWAYRDGEFGETNDCPHVLPLSLREDICLQALKDPREMAHRIEFEPTTTQGGRRALKCSCLFFYGYAPRLDGHFQLSDAKDGTEIFLCHGYDTGYYHDIHDRYHVYKCRKLNGFWKLVLSTVLDRVGHLWRGHGDFLIFL